MPLALTRRRLLGLFAAGCAGAVAAACGSPPTPTQAPAAAPTPAQPAPTAAPAQAKPAASPPAEAKPAATTAPAAAKPLGKEPITLRQWHWDNFLIEPYEKEGAEFAKQFPNITVKVEATPSAEYPQKVTAAIAGGAPPDLIGVTRARADFLLFATNKQLTPLLPLIQRDKFDLDDFNLRARKQHTWKGTIYSLPAQWLTIFWFYSIDRFKQAQLKTPTEYWREGKWTWETYRELAAQLTQGAGVDKHWGTANLTPTWHNAFLSHVWSNKGEWFTADYGKSTLTDPATVGAYQFAMDMRQYAPGPEDARTGTAESGRLGMWPQWDIYCQLYQGKVPFTYSVAPPPASPASGTHVFWGNATGAGIPAGVKQPDASWELLKHILSPEAVTRIYMATGITPPRTSLTSANDFWRKNPNMPPADLMLDLIQLKEKTVRALAKISKYPEMTKAHDEEISLVWAHKQPLTDALKKAGERWDKLLQEGEVDADI
jgi:multiple sugar transport system substrate-binding protein